MYDFEKNISVESHYYDGGFKAAFIGDGPRPDWLPSPDVVGLDNAISLPEDGVAVEISRHLSASRKITWIGAYVAAEDLVYGARSNYVGVGIWLSDYLVVATDKLIDALIQTAWTIKKNGPTAAQGPGKALLTGPDYLRSWVRPLSEFPRVDSGLVFDKSKFPQTIFIDAGIGGNDGAVQRISTSLLCNQLILDGSYNGSSRLVYIATESGRPADISKAELKPLIEKNPATQILTFFSKTVSEAKAETERAYQSREEALAQLSQEKSKLSSALEELARTSTELKQLEGLSQSRLANHELLQDKLRNVYSKTTLVETAQAIFGMSVLFDNEADKVNLKRAMERLLNIQNKPVPTAASPLPRNLEVMPSESVQSADIRAIRSGIDAILNRSMDGENRYPGRSNSDEGKVIRSTASHVQYLRRDISLHLRILIGLFLLSLLLMGSSIVFYYSLADQISEVKKSVN